MKLKIKLPWNSFGNIKNLGIDLGTTTTLVYMRGKGVILREPSVVAINTATNEIIAVGTEANNMQGRTPKNIQVIRPMREGAIADFETTSRMIKYFIEAVIGKNPLFKPQVVISVPFGTTPVEKRAVTEAAKQGGAKDAFLLEEPLAAAIGADLNVEEPEGKMVVNIGGGKTEIAVIALGGIVSGLSIRVGGDSINKAIKDYLRKNYRLEIGEKTSEKIKIEIAHAIEPKTDYEMEVKGLNLRTGLPHALPVKASEIRQAINETLNLICNTIKRIYEKTPPQLASDIIDTGITLTGGGALLKDIDLLIAKELNLPVRIAEDPEACVAIGTGKVTEQLNKLSKISVYHT